MKEVWKDIPNYNGIYQASTLGNIKSLNRKVWMKRNNCYKNIKGRILLNHKNKDGYITVGLRNNRLKRFKTSVLVAITFLNHKPDGTNKVVVDHIDNIKTNNELSNLQLITHRENISKDRKNCSSKYTGVSWDKKSKKWKVSIQTNKKRKYLGYFKTELEASNVYQLALKNINYGK